MPSDGWAITGEVRVDTRRAGNCHFLSADSHNARDVRECVTMGDGDLSPKGFCEYNVKTAAKT